LNQISTPLNRFPRRAVVVGMNIDSIVARRAVLTAGAVAAGTAVLAACSSSAGKPKAAASDAAGSGAPAASGSGGSAGGSGHDTALATLDDIPVGQAVSVKLPDGKPGIVSRPTATTAACFSAICTHEGCTVKPAKTSLNCPCHGSRYNTATGAVLQGPAPSPLAKVSVTVKDGKVISAG
jgi:Rieske Fe-S protein